MLLSLSSSIGSERMASCGVRGRSGVVLSAGEFWGTEASDGESDSAAWRSSAKEEEDIVLMGEC